MRHHKKRHRLAKPADQRKALIRSIASKVIEHGEVITTLARAKATQLVIEKLVTMASKQKSVHTIRQASRWIFNYPIPGKTVDTAKGKQIPLTILRKLFVQIGPQFQSHTSGGYTKVVKVPPRRGDAAPMALLQLVASSTAE